MAIDTRAPAYAAFDASASTSQSAYFAPESDYDAPPYSAQPALDERILDHTHSPYHSEPTGTVVRAVEHLTLTLNAQVDGTEVPSYRQHGIVRGEVVPVCPAGIESISIKFEGHLEMTLGGIGRPVSTRFFNLKRVLWSAPDSNFFAAPPCPRRLDFQMKIPASYRGKNLKEYALPPSCEIAFLDAVGSACSVKCRYTLSVGVEKTSRFIVSRRNNWFPVDVKYDPQNLPPRPLMPLHIPFSETPPAMMPAWRVLITPMQTRDRSGIEPVQCQLYIPSTPIFGTSSPIAFHVKLVGPAHSLRSLCAPGTANATPRPLVRVRILRHIHANSHRNNIRKVVVLGEGELIALPPREDEDILSWDGSIQCNADAEVGGFTVDDMLDIRDFVVINVYPPSSRTSPLVEMEHMHPIRLVNDRWIVDHAHP
ncbi:hypothetical protein FIBSPDRAFT_819935 [Athelia psychrophila]|uniref:Arrestin-like N-terminal domain-containing protein n=1 Tax=Athelia psychrophila TaxID=1759441 RepID=A0A166PL27_9AGAM|nr:hypothetical protein FIBSPDRAFT_819935 [Fibularhizoctonia sp. CBS 109695]